MKKNFLDALIDNPNIRPSNQNTLGYISTTRRSKSPNRSPRAKNGRTKTSHWNFNDDRYGYHRQMMKRFDRKGPREIFERMYLTQCDSSWNPQQ